MGTITKLVLCLRINYCVRYCEIYSSEHSGLVTCPRFATSLVDYVRLGHHISSSKQDSVNQVERCGKYLCCDDLHG